MTSDIRNNFTHWSRGPGTARDPETLRRGHLPNGARGGRVVTPVPDTVNDESGRHGEPGLPDLGLIELIIWVGCQIDVIGADEV